MRLEISLILAAAITLCSVAHSASADWPSYNRTLTSEQRAKAAGSEFGLQGVELRRVVLVQRGSHLPFEGLAMSIAGIGFL